MKKETLELSRSRSISRYGDLNPPVSESDILDSIVDFSKDKNISIYKHLLRIEEENISTTEFYSVPTITGKIPYCDKVYYLDIYFQERL